MQARTLYTEPIAKTTTKIIITNLTIPKHTKSMKNMNTKTRRLYIKQAHVDVFSGPRWSESRI